MELTELPNIGKILAKKLRAIDIHTPDELKRVGSEKAIIRIAALDSDACVNILYAIDGAVQGIRWHALSKSRKQELFIFFHSITYLFSLK